MEGRTQKGNKRYFYENKRNDIVKLFRNKPFVLETDASDEAIGAILRKNCHTIEIYSKYFPACERNYSVVEKETFAVIKAVEHFKNIIIKHK